MERVARTGGTGGPWVSFAFELGLHGNIADTVPWKQGRERTCSLVTCRTGGRWRVPFGTNRGGKCCFVKEMVEFPRKCQPVTKAQL